MDSIRILLVDDHHIVRQGVRALLEAEPDLIVVGEAADGLEAIPLIEREKPDVVILDLMMPGLNGLDLTRQIRQRLPVVRVVVLSMHDNEAYVVQAWKNGAQGYVLKESSVRDLTQAVRTVYAGERYLSPPLSVEMIEAYLRKTKANALDTYDTLTTRERQVLQLTVEGCTSVQIAERLCISPRTAETHRANLMRKLSVHNQTDLIRYALQRGILPLDP